jgi:predicted Zn-ribbon and HTH transcriptional regulator
MTPGAYETHRDVGYGSQGGPCPFMHCGFEFKVEPVRSASRIPASAVTQARPQTGP